MTRTVRRLAPALLVALALPASASAALPADEHESSRWRVEQVVLDGSSTHRLDDDRHYEADGRVYYRTTPKTTSNVLDLRLRKTPTPVVGTIRQLTWQAKTTAHISDDEQRWNCDAEGGPSIETLAGIFIVTKRSVRVQWSLAPTYLRCPPGAPAWSFPGMPAAAMTSTFPRKKLLRVRKVVLPISIDEEWDDEAGHTEVAWDGRFTLKRLK